VYQLTLTDNGEGSAGVGVCIDKFVRVEVQQLALVPLLLFSAVK
jgi:hypothetical protein